MAVNIQTITNYAKACGVKHILQTKPFKLPNANFEGLQVLGGDIFIYKNPYWCKMTAEEKALIPEFLHNTKMGKAFAKVIPSFRNLGYEKAYVFDNYGKLMAKSGTRNHATCAINQEDSRRIKEYPSALFIAIRQRLHFQILI